MRRWKSLPETSRYNIEVIYTGFMGGLSFSPPDAEWRIIRVKLKRFVVYIDRISISSVLEPINNHRAYTKASCDRGRVIASVLPGFYIVYQNKHQL